MTVIKTVTPTVCLGSPSHARRGIAALCGLALAGALFTSLSVVPARSQDDPVVAKVNGMEFKQSDVALAEDELGAKLPAPDAASKQDQLVTYVADMLLLAKAAQDKGMASTTDFAHKLAYERSKLLMEEMLKQASQQAVTDEALHKTYDEALGQMKGEEEIKASHILVPTEDEAKAIEAELKKGADFATLAKEKSKDPGSGKQGGDLGYFTKDQMVPEFSEAAFKLKKGEISAPVKSSFGWHIIKLEDKRTKKPPEFDQVKDQLAQYVARKAQADLISKLRETAKIERVGAPPAAAGSATPPAAGSVAPPAGKKP
jgi:peptidyl-prolyl cis-trans isomerase C